MFWLRGQARLSHLVRRVNLRPFFRAEKALLFKDMNLFARAFSIDYRSLRFCRAALGVLTIIHALQLSYTFEALFTDRGLIPYDLITGGGAVAYVFSFFHFSQAGWMAWAHFFGLSVCGLGLIYNRYPRLSSIIAYALVISINNRISFAYYSADILLATMFLWMSFLPPGKPKDSKSNSFSSLASIAALLQIAYLYVFAGFLKSWDFWFVEGKAAYFALQGDLYARPLGSWMADHVPYPILQWASRLVLIWERFGPILIFSPWGFVWCRIAVFAGFALMHLKFAATMAIGIFPGVDLVFLILLIPGEVWDYIAHLKPFQHLPELETFARKESPVDFFAPVIIAFLFCVTVWNLKRLEFKILVPKTVKWAAQHLSLKQNWGMFAPTPFASDGWFVIQGTTLSGRAADVLQGKYGWADFRRPKVISATFPSERWVAASAVLRLRQGEPNRIAFADLFCRQWREKGNEPLRDLKVWFVEETTVDKYQYQPVNGRLLIAKKCSE